MVNAYLKVQLQQQLNNETDKENLSVRAILHITAVKFLICQGALKLLCNFLDETP
jgi:hypothetical protein